LNIYCATTIPEFNLQPLSQIYNWLKNKWVFLMNGTNSLIGKKFWNWLCI
jgi:hypothetical protein